MEAILFDTDVFSYLMKGDTRAAVYSPHIKGKTVALSFISIGELYAWAVIRNWNEKRVADLEQRLKALVVIPYDQELCREFGRVKASLPKGRAVPSNDLWIATCAIRHSIPLLTHNRKHFQDIPRLVFVDVPGAGAPPQPKPGQLFPP